MNPDNSAALVEYQSAHAAYLHYDAFRWQAGSFLVAGVFVFWGLVINGRVPSGTLAYSSFLVAMLMSIWLLYAHHYRQIYLGKLDRLQELEAKLGMEQHLRFVPDVGTTTYRTFGPRGHRLNMAVFVVTALGGSVISFSENGFSPWQLMPLGPVVVVLTWVLTNERKVQSYLRSHGTSPSRRMA